MKSNIAILLFGIQLIQVFNYYMILDFLSLNLGKEYYYFIITSGAGAYKHIINVKICAYSYNQFLSAWLHQFKICKVIFA